MKCGRVDLPVAQVACGFDTVGLILFGGLLHLQL